MTITKSNVINSRKEIIANQEIIVENENKIIENMTNEDAPPKETPEQYKSITAEGKEVLKYKEITIEFKKAKEITMAKSPRQRLTMILNTIMTSEELAKQYLSENKLKTIPNGQIFEKSIDVIELRDMLQRIRKITSTTEIIRKHYREWMSRHFSDIRDKSDSEKVAKRNESTKNYVAKRAQKNQEEKNEKKRKIAEARPKQQQQHKKQPPGINTD